MTEDEGHGQQDVSHYGCDQALKVGGLDLKNRAKSNKAGGDCRSEGDMSQLNDEITQKVLTYSSKPRPTTEKWPMWQGQNAKGGESEKRRREKK